MRMKRFFAPVLTGSLLATTLVGGADKPAVATVTNPAPAAAKAPELFEDAVLARGKGFEIKRSQLDAMFMLVQANYTAAGRPLADEDRLRLQARLLDSMVGTRLLVQRATDHDRMTAKMKVDTYWQDAKRKNNSTDLLLSQLKAMGMNSDQFLANLMDDTLSKEVLERELVSKVVVPEDNIRAFYESNPKEFSDPEMVKLSCIFFSTRQPASPDRAVAPELSEEQRQTKRKLAESVLARARKGEDFISLVKEFSEDLDSKNKGGEYRITRSVDDPARAMRPEVEAAAFSLQPGKISDIVTTVTGFFILKSLEKTPVQKRGYTEVREVIRQFMQREEMQKQMPAFFARLKKEAGVEVLAEELKLREPGAGITAPARKP
jgi:parvulin-like peptidyl-prolyl isomerase